MVDRASSYTSYREQFAGLAEQGMETEGIWDEAAFQAVVGDARTVSLALDDGAVLPLLTPMINLPYTNIDYYRREADKLAGSSTTGDIWYYTHLPNLWDRQRAMLERLLIPAVGRVAMEGGVIAYDTPTGRIELTDRQVISLLGQIGETSLVALPDMPVHFQYASRLELAGVRQQHNQLPLDFPGLYAAAKAAGSPTVDGTVEVVGTMDDVDITHIWGYYQRAHDVLTSGDVVYAGFSESELRQVLSDPSITKFAYRVDGQVSNLSIVASITNCPWLNAEYFAAHYPEQFPDRIICGIGAISDPDAPKGLTPPTLHTAGVLGKLIADAGADAILMFVCDDQSNRYIPRISESAMRRAKLTVDFSRPMGQQLFRAILFRP